MNFLGVKYLGTEYGGWYYKPSLIHQESVCYLAGAGEDISFDLAIYDKHNCDVHIFDPTPRAIEFCKNNIRHGIKFHPYGLYNVNENVKFYSPENKEHVSHSIINLQDTNSFFWSHVVTIETAMELNGHKKIDLLKLDVEGVECEIIEQMFIDNIYPKQILVEFDELVVNPTENSRKKIEYCINTIYNYGYKLFAKDGKSNYCFLLTK